MMSKAIFSPRRVVNLLSYDYYNNNNNNNNKIEREGKKNTHNHTYYWEHSASGVSSDKILFLK